LAGEIGRRVREMHKSIKGTRPDGERYHALEPEAYAWVHATLADAIVRGHRLFGRDMSPATVEAFYADWLKLGRLIGVRERDLPARWADFEPYFDRMVDGALEDNPTVHLVLDTLRRPAKPLPSLPTPVWKAANGAPVLTLVTVGMLPPRLRAKLGLRWTARDARAFRAFCAAARAATPLIVRTRALREFGPLYVRMRRKQLERGDVARARQLKEPSWAA
jgi:uncharacterized protein (DUF2236 family)